MTKTLAAAKRQERVKFKVPRSVQDAIPIRRIWPDGIFQVGNQYSKSWSFTDINYAIADKDDKMAMFLDYCALLNALDSGASAKITIHNRRIDKEDFERSVLLPCTAMLSTTTGRNSTRCCAPRSPAPATAWCGSGI